MKLLVGANDKLLEGSAEELVFLNCPHGVTKLRRKPSCATTSPPHLSTPNPGNHGTVGARVDEDGKWVPHIQNGTVFHRLSVRFKVN